MVQPLFNCTVYPLSSRYIHWAHDCPIYTDILSHKLSYQVLYYDTISYSTYMWHTFKKNFAIQSLYMYLSYME